MNQYNLEKSQYWFINYSEIIKFINDFEPSITVTKQIIYNYKDIKLVIKSVPREVSIISFIDYVKLHLP